MRKFILSILTIFCTAFAYSQTGSVSGSVKDKEGKAIEFASIKLNSMSRSTTVNGNFKFEGLAGGSYMIEVSSIGFETARKEVILADGQAATVDFVLETDRSSFLKEIIVTSRKKEQLKEDFTSAVTVVNTQSIQSLQTVNNNVSDILAATVPGLGLSSGSSSNWGQTLRGRQVLILIDGVSQSTPLRNGSVDIRTIDPNVIERIEVIKGASSIYGNGAAGGIINYITKTNNGINQKFGSKSEFGVTGSAVNASGSVGARFNQSVYGRTGKFDYTVSGSYEQTGKVRDAEGDIVGPTYGLSNNKIYNAFAKIGYQINDAQRLQLNYNFFSSLEETNLAEVMGSRVDDRKTLAIEGTTPGMPPGTRWNHNALAKYVNDCIFGKTSLTVNGYVQDFNTLFFYSTNFENGGQSTIQSSKKGIRTDLNTPLISGNNLEADVTYGLDVMNDVTSQPLLDGRSWVPKMDMLSNAPFLQLQATLFQDFVFNGGLRYESINIGVEDYLTLKPYNAQSNTFGTSMNVKGGEINYGNLVFNSGLRYNKFDFFRPYVNFAQGFSVADLGLLLRGARVNDISKIQTEPVIIDNYETGFSSEFKAFRFEASGYISKSKLGSSFVEQDGFYVIVRQPEFVYGFELSADIIASKNITLGSSYSYVEGKRDGNGNDKYDDAEDTYLGGERITPPKFTTYLTYSPGSKFTFRTDLIAAGGRNRFAPNATTGVYKTYEGRVDPYEIVNLSSTYKVGRATMLKLGVENILNADYFPARSLWPSLNQYYVKGRGTTVTLGLSAQF